MRVAVLVPCFNEEAAVATVVADFRRMLPAARILVYDNNSSDRTVAVALDAGAEVRHERRQGKGHVVRRMFADIDADIYVLVDGDATYDAASAPRMIEALVANRLDMVVGFRVDQAESAYRRGHRTGNRMLTGFSRRCSERRSRISCPATGCCRGVSSSPFRCCRTVSRSRPNSACTRSNWHCRWPKSKHPISPARPGSFSKLNTWRDGFRILGTILKLYRSEKPLRFFAVIGIFLIRVSIGLAIPILVTYLEVGLVPRLPTAVLSMGLMILAMLAISSGLVLDTVTRGRREMKLLAYLTQPPLGGD